MSSDRVITSLAFSKADQTALSERVTALKRAGVSARPVTVLRALVYTTSESDLIARCVRLTAALALKGETAAPTVDRPTVKFDKGQLKKLDDAVQQLERANIVVNRSFAVRAILQEAPRGKELLDLYRAFLEKFPFKPRGLSKLRLEKKAARGGR